MKIFVTAIIVILYITLIVTNILILRHSRNIIHTVENSKNNEHKYTHQYMDLRLKHDKDDDDDSQEIG